MTSEKRDPITLDQARELLLKAVETQGRDFVYNPGGVMVCLYRPITDDEAPRHVPADHPSRKTGCLIGVALSLAGETRHLEIHGAVSTFESNGLTGLLTPDAARYFSKAQHHQDIGSTWGQAYDAAEEWANSLQEAAP